MRAIVHICTTQKKLRIFNILNLFCVVYFCTGLLNQALLCKFQRKDFGEIRHARQLIQRFRHFFTVLLNQRMPVIAIKLRHQYSLRIVVQFKIVVQYTITSVLRLPVILSYRSVHVQ